MPILESRCLKCGETAANADEGDPHFEKQDGTPCGGELELWGQWG
jgi:hypothetical protein